MRDPQEALAAARERAAASRAAPPLQPETWDLEDSPLSSKRLAEWSIIEPDEESVYSTRRFGRPITAFKRLLIRLMRQYLSQATAQQSRFNAYVAAQLVALDERVKALEDTAGRAESAAGEDQPTPR